jgi:hypothetical protein
LSLKGDRPDHSARLKVDLVDIIESKAAELPNAKLNQAYFYGSRA